MSVQHNVLMRMRNHPSLHCVQEQIFIRLERRMKDGKQQSLQLLQCVCGGCDERERVREIELWFCRRMHRPKFGRECVCVCVREREIFESASEIEHCSKCATVCVCVCSREMLPIYSI